MKNKKIIAILLFTLCLTLMVKFETLNNIEKNYNNLFAKNNVKNYLMLNDGSECEDAIHFISVGSSDAILIESDCKYALVDSSNPYDDPDDPNDDVYLQGIEIYDKTVMRVKDYLKAQGVEYLDFIIATHSHSDHIGGMPVIAENFVDSRTKYYYKEHDINDDDGDAAGKNTVLWHNHDYYNLAINAISPKVSQQNMIVVTNKDIEFSFGHFNIKLVNTEKSPLNNYYENRNSIGTLVTYTGGENDYKVFLSADMEADASNSAKDIVGDVDVLKLNHHGHSGTTLQYLDALKPENLIVTNDQVLERSLVPIVYLSDTYKTKVFYTTNQWQDDTKVAIKVNFNSNDYSITDNNGNLLTNAFDSPGYQEILNGLAQKSHWKIMEKGSVDQKMQYDNFYFNGNAQFLKGWQYLTWSSGTKQNWFYFDPKKANMRTGWQYIAWEGNEENDWFYFDLVDGYMKTGWQELEWGNDNKQDWFYFDLDHGYMKKGWQELEWSGGTDKFYFDLEHGFLIKNTDLKIGDKYYRFDNDGLSNQIYRLTYKNNNEILEEGYHEENKTIDLIKDLEKTGYQLVGWKSNDKVYTLNEKFTMKAEDIILSAQWEPNKYILTYDSLEGKIKEVTYDSTYGELETPTRAGYEFQGWYLDSEYKTKVTSETKVKTTDNHTLYAKWNVAFPDIEHSTQYKIENLMIKGISLKTNIDNFSLGLDNVYNLKIYNKDEDEKINGNIATGDKVKIYLDNSLVSEYIVSIKGDVTGTGNATISDVAKLYQYLKNKISIEDCYKNAGDVVGTDNQIKINDVAKLYQFIKGKIDSLEE